MTAENPTARAGAARSSAGGPGASAAPDDDRAGTAPAARDDDGRGTAPGATDGGRDKTWTVLALLTWTSDYFKRAGIDTARLDAEVLLAHALETERLRLYIDYEKPVHKEERDAFRALVQRRAQERVPVSLLIGEREFWSLPFKVTSDVLTPRPETETLVEWALSKAAPRSQEGAQVADSESTIRILDIGTGSGAIALALASELPHAAVTATDLSPAALQIAAENADGLRTGERIRFVEGDLFEPVAKEKYDLIVSNPPYVARTDAGSLPPELSHEPELALFGGPDGLEVIRRLIAEAGEYLSAGGWLGIELSPEQAERVEAAFEEAGFTEVERRFDLASRPRVVAGRWPVD